MNVSTGPEICLVWGVGGEKPKISKNVSTWPSEMNIILQQQKPKTAF